ncbi:MAG TPA: PLP-dependent aminotransferase family protein, partial [Clostridiaceae bacterium]|nr:PLP-dependent aminotransferase family protein [Clostridiaceae bacterium]
IYNHYKDLIVSGKLKPGAKLPSIRKCALERMISRTTVEAAYLQLSAEGYIISKPGSGFYV